MMIREEREARILAALRERGIVSLEQLGRELVRVSTVTLRRDLVRLAARGALIRTRGGALAAGRAAPVGATTPAVTAGLDPARLDAIVLPPIPDAWATTLRALVRRRGIPFLAESAPQEGGVYLGPDNRAAGRDLGRVAGDELARRGGPARILLVTIEALANTRERAEGFLEGVRERFDGVVASWQVDGGGVFASAFRASLDALQAHPGIDVVFAVNDHSITAALEAAERLAIRDVRAYSVGVEGDALLDRLVTDPRLRACAALFPEITGQRAVDALARALAGGPLPKAVATPHAVLTRETLDRYYRRSDEGWRPVGQDTPPADRIRWSGRQPVIGFLPHYPQHDWYRNMARAMRERAAVYGIELQVARPEAGVGPELTRLRRTIARVASERIAAGDVVLIGTGEAPRLLAEELPELPGLTVVTHALPVMELLAGRPGVKVILTSGEPHPAGRCLVGPSLGALFETMRVDRAFLTADGVTARFGISATDERIALATRRCIEAAREVVVLADHTAVGVDATVRIAPLDRVDTIVTDAGTLPADRLSLAAAGARIVVADDDPPAPHDRRDPLVTTHGRQR
jgi:DeoR/GlpR family transcriptional regulator of sugar metabolism/ABC-type sugar transport system substrate-binding protein